MKWGSFLVENQLSKLTENQLNKLTEKVTTKEKWRLKKRKTKDDFLLKSSHRSYWLEVNFVSLDCNVIIAYFLGIVKRFTKVF